MGLWWVWEVGGGGACLWGDGLVGDSRQAQGPPVCRVHRELRGRPGFQALSQLRPKALAPRALVPPLYAASPLSPALLAPLHLALGKDLWPQME